MATLIEAETERNDPGYMDRRPFLYLPERSRLVIGKPGTHHSDLLDHQGINWYSHEPVSYGAINLNNGVHSHWSGVKYPESVKHQLDQFVQENHPELSSYQPDDYDSFNDQKFAAGYEDGDSAQHGDPMVSPSGAGVHRPVPSCIHCGAPVAPSKTNLCERCLGAQGPFGRGTETDSIQVGNDSSYLAAAPGAERYPLPPGAAPWTPGVFGRGIIGPQGQFHSWIPDYDYIDEHPDEFDDLDLDEWHHGDMGEWLARKGHDWAHPSKMDRGQPDSCQSVYIDEDAHTTGTFNDAQKKALEYHGIEPRENHWKFANLHHNWTAPNEGKGFILDNGTPVTWNLDMDSDHPAPYDQPQYSSPHHQDMAYRMKLNFDPNDEQMPEDLRSHRGWHTPVYINSEGEVFPMSYWPGSEHQSLEPFKQLGLTPHEHQEDWKFSNTDPVETVREHLVNNPYVPYEGEEHDYHMWQPGQVGKGFISSDGRPVTWNINGSNVPAFAGPHHREVAEHMGMPGFPEQSDKSLQEDRQALIDNGFNPDDEAFMDAPSWHTPIYINPDGTYNTLNRYWNEANWKVNPHNTFESVGLKNADVPEDQWKFGVFGKISNEKTWLDHPSDHYFTYENGQEIGPFPAPGPYRRGQEGKGYVQGDKLTLWPVNENSQPHHDDMIPTDEEYPSALVYVDQNNRYQFINTGNRDKDEIRGVLNAHGFTPSDTRFSNAEHHKWRPGRPGKGMIVNNEPVTWNTNVNEYFPDQPDYFGPHHEDVLYNMGVDPAYGGWDTPVYINEKGEVFGMDHWDRPADDLTPFKNVGLKPIEKQDEWKFSKTGHRIDEYAPFTVNADGGAQAINHHDSIPWDYLSTLGIKPSDSGWNGWRFASAWSDPEAQTYERKTQQGLVTQPVIPFTGNERHGKGYIQDGKLVLWSVDGAGFPHHPHVMGQSETASIPDAWVYVDRATNGELKSTVVPVRGKIDQFNDIMGAHGLPRDEVDNPKFAARYTPEIEYDESIPWTPGQHGKAAWVPHSNKIHIWGVGDDEDGQPIHADYVDQRYMDQEPENWTAYSNEAYQPYVIDPQGAVTNLRDMKPGEDHRGLIANAINGTVSDRSWYFGKTASFMLPWAKGDLGKAVPRNSAKSKSKASNRGLLLLKHEEYRAARGIVSRGMNNDDWRFGQYTDEPYDPYEEERPTEWQPGYEAKIIVTSDGQVHTWTDGERHNYYAEDHGIPWESVTGEGWVNTDGQTQGLNPHDAQLAAKALGVEYIAQSPAKFASPHPPSQTAKIPNVTMVPSDQHAWDDETGLLEGRPYIYDVQSDHLYMGDKRSHHWPMIYAVPELQRQYDMSLRENRPPNAENNPHLYGRVYDDDDTDHVWVTHQVSHDKVPRVNGLISNQFGKPVNSDEFQGWEFPTKFAKSKGEQDVRRQTVDKQEGHGENRQTIQADAKGTAGSRSLWDNERSAGKVGEQDGIGPSWRDHSALVNKGDRDMPSMVNLSSPHNHPQTLIEPRSGREWEFVENIGDSPLPTPMSTMVIASQRRPAPSGAYANELASAVAGHNSSLRQFQSQTLIPYASSNKIDAQGVNRSSLSLRAEQGEVIDSNHEMRPKQIRDEATLSDISGKRRLDESISPVHPGIVASKTPLMNKIEGEKPSICNDECGNTYGYCKHGVHYGYTLAELAQHSPSVKKPSVIKGIPYVLGNMISHPDIGKSKMEAFSKKVDRGPATSSSESTTVFASAENFENWKFAGDKFNNKIKVVQAPNMPGRNKNQEPLQDRVPYVHDPQTNTVYVGRGGWHHNGVIDAMGRRKSDWDGLSFGYIFPNEEPKPVHYWYSKIRAGLPENHIEIEDAINDHLGIDADHYVPWDMGKFASAINVIKIGEVAPEPWTPGNYWHFGKISAQIEFHDSEAYPMEEYGEHNDPDNWRSKAMIYTPDDDKLHIGEHDEVHHSDILDNLSESRFYAPDHYKGALFRDSTGINYQWYDQPENEEELAKSLSDFHHQPVKRKPYDPNWSFAKTANKLEWLESRPDKAMATPEGKQFFQILKDGFWSDKTDPLFPWLWREYKKNRLNFVDRHTLSINDDFGHISLIGKMQLDHIADWFASGNKNPTRRGVDIMQLTGAGMLDKITRWDNWLKEQNQESNMSNGKVIYQLPNGWTIRELAPEDLSYEGDNMGHCVGGHGYENAVQNGHTKIISLRDEKNEPHATMELAVNNRIEPHDPGRYVIEQVQGKSNEIPKPEYQAMLKQWIQSLLPDDRPIWKQPSYRIDDIDEITGEDPHDEYGWGGYEPHGDYGVYTPVPETSYDNVLYDIHQRGDRATRWGEREYNPEHGEAVYDHALKRGEIPELAKAYQGYQDKTQEAIYDVEDQNIDWLDYPGEYEDQPEFWDKIGEEEGKTGKEAYEEAYERYSEAHSELMEGIPQYQAAHHIGELLAPHWNHETNSFTNEKAKPQTFSSWKFAVNLQEWELGSEGKGYIDPNGEPLIWKVDKQGYPHHVQVFNDRDEDPYAMIQIRSDGNMIAADPRELDEVVDDYLNYHPDLKREPHPLNFA